MIIYSKALPSAGLASLLAISTGCFSAQSFAQQQSLSLAEALNSGTTEVHLRYRYEMVDQDNLAHNAHASTLRSRLTYKTGVFQNFTTQLEIDNVTGLGADNHNSVSNGMTDHPVVADPEGTEINQAWISYGGIDDTSAKYGRQRINLDNQRFIGGVAWRQNEQTYDGFSLVNTAVEDITFSYAYINNINRIFGPDDGAKPADLDAKTHILNINHQGLPIGKLSAYSYWLDIKDAPAASTHTAGLRLSGKAEADRLTYNYSAEYAHQSDYGNNSLDFDADYYLLELGLVANGLSAKVGLEVLEGDSALSGQSFRTPLATLHKFNGWADQFLNTPDAGLEDRYFQVGGKISDIAFEAVYHQFDAQDGGDDYGTEMNFSVAKKICEHRVVSLKYANFSADDFGSDVEKVWLQMVLGF